MKQRFYIAVLCITALLAACSSDKSIDPTPSQQAQPTQPNQPVLAITDFNPKSAVIGATVMITGTAFGTDSNAVTIKFGNSVGIKPKAISANSLTVTVPKDAQTGQLSVTVGNSTVISSDIFTLTATVAPAPTITSFTPPTAAVGETVTINGTAFGTDTNFVAIKFGTSKAVKPKTVTTTKMTVVVPSDAQTGKIQITVNGGTAVSSTDNFTLKIIPLAVTGFTNYGKVGDKVTFLGTGFGTDTNRVTVSFGGSTPIKPKAVTATTLDVIVPANAVTGTVVITVNGVSVTTSTFTVNLSVISFSPKSFTEGDTLKITGAAFTSISDIYVDLNTTTGTLIRPYQVTPTQILLVVPFNAQSGRLKVSGYVGTQYDYGKENFTFTPRLSFSFTTTSGRPGEVVKFSGDFTNATLSGISVSFGGSAGTQPLSISGRDILVRVPNDAKTGKITITNTGYTPGTNSTVFTVLSPLPTPVSGQWTAGAGYGTSGTFGRLNSFAFVIGSKAYVGCGSTGSPFDGIGSSDVWEFDPQYNAWTQKANFGGGVRTAAAAFAIGSKGYVGTGLNSSNVATSDLWEYDPSANTWAQKADFKGGARSYAVGFTIGNIGYIGTGSASGNNFNDFYSYNASTNTWAQIASMPVARNQAYAFVSNSKAYVGNGYATTQISDLNMYDPSTNVWTVKAAIPSFATYGSAAFSIGDKGYVGLGYTGSTTNKFFEYSTATNTWKSLNNYGGYGRTAAVGFAINDVGYMGMGTTFPGIQAEKDFWAYKQ